MNIKNLPHMSDFSAALNVEKQTLFLCSHNDLTEIQLNNNHISNYNHNSNFLFPRSMELITHNNSLFIIGSSSNHSILKWDSEKKAFIQFNDMYNKMNTDSFAMISNNKNNTVLLFGG
eukprot:473885_1